MRVYFYDDDPVNITTFKAAHPSVRSVLVKNEGVTPILKNMDAFYYPTMFHRMYPHNRYAATLIEEHDIMHPQKVRPELACRICGVKVGQGLTVAEIRKIARRRAEVVLFDWDLTLSVCNGLILPRDKEYSNAEVAQYCAGTLERFNALREMFAELRRRGTKIYILTNNGWAQDDTVERFSGVVQVFDGQIAKEDIVYGRGEKAVVYSTDQRFRVFTRKRKRRGKRTQRFLVKKV